MQVDRSNDEKLFMETAIRQVADEYMAKGYTVIRNERIGRYQADLVAKKGFDRIIIEVVSGDLTPEKKKKLMQIRNYLTHHGQADYKFTVVVTHPPKQRNIEIKGIENALFNYFLSIDIDAFAEVSSNYEIVNVYNVDIKDVTLDEGKLFATGHGIISLKLQYGSSTDISKDDGLEMDENFPFDFKARFEYEGNKELKVEDMRYLKFDTTSFFD